MRLISWNISHPKNIEDIRIITKHLSSKRADLVALQEIAIKQPHLDRLVDQLRSIGLIQTCHLVPDRGWGLLIAGRYPMREIDGLPGAYLEVPKEERSYDRNPTYSSGERLRSRILSVRVEGKGTPFELHTVHIPYGSGRGWRKIDTFRALAARLGKRSPMPRIVCGDFNEPRGEHEDGRIETWAGRNNFSKVAPDRWDEAVKKIFVECSSFGLTDVIRNLHGSKTMGMVSHYPRGIGKPRRYDHVFASGEIKVKEACYLPKKNVSDHVPVKIDFDLA